MESNTHPRVLIIGSGVCGLYAGLTLARAGAKVAILEKEPRIGGLAAGFKFGENFCDFGVHMLHAFNQEIFEDCAALMGEERIEAALDARIRWGGTSCRYPLRFRDMLKAMPLFTLSRCVLGLLIAEFTGAKKRKGINNAEDALVAFYGAPLYEYFFEEFTHQYWNIHPRNLSAEFIRRKMPRLSAVDMLRKFLPFKKKTYPDVTESALDTETLHYSKTGSETLPRSLAQEFTKLGGKLLTEARITSISLTPCQASYSHQDHEHR
jgi:protoporphyrinogen oxidase